MREILQPEKAESFAPFFSDRVMRRIQSLSPTPPQSAGSLYDSLRWVFWRFSAAAVAAIVVLSILNLLQFGATEGTDWVEALLGLPSNTLADMLTYDLI